MRKIQFTTIHGALALLLAGILGGAAGCVKEVPQKPYYDTDSSRQQFGNTKLKKKKVLLIAIDGANADVVKAMQPPVIKELLPSSIYSFNGLADTSVSVASSWATLTTGVQYDLHRIYDSSLIPLTDKGGHTDVKYYESFITTVKLDDIATKVTAITPWEDMTSFLLSGADKVVNTPAEEGDQAVEAAALASLKSDADIVLVNFNAPAVAGQTSGFDAGNTSYTKAILDTDTRIGKLIAGMKARSSFADENWLVIIQSTGGGYGTKLGSHKAAARFTFSIYHNPDLVAAEYTKVHKIADEVVRFNGGASDYVRAVNNDGGLYNVGTGAITVEAKVKFNKNPANGKYEWTFPPFISKVAVRSGNTPGWSMFKNGDKVTWFVADGNNKSELLSKSLPDANWHTLTGVVYKDGTTYKTALYIDGENKLTGSITATPTGNVTTASPFILGWMQDPFTNASNNIDMYMADVRVWNTVLTDQEIKDWAFSTGDLSAHPKFTSLIGYWPAQEGSNAVLKDLSPSKKDFTLQGNYTWNFMGSAFDGSTTNPPSLIDVVPSMYYWLGITIEGNKKPPGTNRLKLKVQ